MRLIGSIAAAAVVAMSSIASAEIVVFTTSMSGAIEFPNPVVTNGSGTSTVTWDTAAHTMRLQFSFQDLTGNSTVGHIHGPTASPFAGGAGVMTPTPNFPGFPAGGPSGSYDVTFDMWNPASYGGAFLTANGGLAGQAEIALFNAMATGRAYLNIHSSFVSSGEIRGFYVPAPASAGLLGMGLLVAARRRR
jgi:hypothetical protein